MKKTISVVCLGVAVVGTSIVLGGCESDTVDSVTTASTGTSSSSSSSGDGGAGGAGGAAGAGGMMSVGGNGGMGGGMAGAGGMGMGGSGPTCMKTGDACADCLYDQCENAYCDCASEPACFAIIGCLEACPPMMPDCPAGCFATNSKGFAEFTIASSCAATLCAPSCPNTDQVKPCDLCLAQKCEMQLETCLSDLQCFQLISCRDTCMGMMACENQCNNMYPQGVPLVQALFMCAATGCTGICN